MLTKSRSVNAFIEKIRRELVRGRFRLIITKSNNVYAKDGTPVCCGIFLPPTTSKGIGRIRVAAGGQSLSEVILSIAHEYIHWRQWKNKEKIYLTDDYYKLEKNTERRALSLMIKAGLPKKMVQEAAKHSAKYLSDLKSGVI